MYLNNGQASNFSISDVVIRCLSTTKVGDRKMSVYEYAIVEYPTEEQEKKGDLEKIIVKPREIVAKDSEAAKRAALIEHSTQLIGVDPNRIGVLVRPFY